MTKAEINNRIDDTDTVSAQNAPESTFEARAARARDYVDLNPDMISHHNERGARKPVCLVNDEEEEGIRPHW